MTPMEELIDTLSGELTPLQRQFLKMCEHVRKGGKIILLKPRWPSREERRAKLMAALFDATKPHGSTITVTTAGGREEE